jgi:hypothetical protein
MVLDAVARIEQTLEALQQSTPDTRLAEILTTISDIVDQATELAAAAADGLAIDDRLAPIHRGARILKEISWRWREIGAESRICDSIESQVDAIQESCSRLARIDPRAGLTAAFELMRTRIEALARENGLVPPVDRPATKFDAADSEIVAVAEPVEPASAGCAAPPELSVAPASEPHPSLGSTPFAAEIQEPRRPPEIDSVAVIRRMSLVEKYAFFE